MPIRSDRIAVVQESINTFNDSSNVPKWGKEVYEAVINQQISVGINQNNLRQMDTANRAEGVTILLRFMQ